MARYIHTATAVGGFTKLAARQTTPPPLCAPLFPATNYLTVGIVYAFKCVALFFFSSFRPSFGGSSQRYLHGVIDLTVRSLDPATENVSRESYGALHQDDTRPHQVDAVLVGKKGVSRKA